MAARKRSRQSGPSIMRQLLKSRSVLLFGPIEPKKTQEVIAQLLLLDSMDHEKPIRLFINSPGGVADDGFAIYDVIKFVKAPVYTIVSGLAASAATIVMVAPPKERRLVLAHSRIMLHQPSVGVQGTASDIAISAKEILRLRAKANALFHKETGVAVDKLAEDMHRDFWMSAEEAIEYGLIDRILQSSDELDS